MRLWLVLGIILALLALLLATPVGVRAIWDGTLAVKIRIGPFHFQIFPRKKKKEKEEKPKKPKKPKEKKKKRFSVCLEQILYTIDVGCRLLGKILRRFYRGLRFDPFKLHITAAAPDPADAAVLYGRLYGGIAALLPMARELVPIKNEDVVLLLDFEKPGLEAEADIGVYMRLAHIFGIGFTALGGLIVWAWGFKKRAKPAKKADKKTEKAGKKDKTEETEKKEETPAS